jgi:F-type H+-transporting ATPase subunit epsilon
MKLRVYSLRKVLYEGSARSLNLKTDMGEITILDKHIPLIASLKAGNMKILDNEEKIRNIYVSSGFLEVKPHSEVTVLAEE